MDLIYVTHFQGMKGGPYPGLFLFTIAARLIRPVLQRATGRTEYIGPMEQPFIDIACLPEVSLLSKKYFILIELIYADRTFHR